MQYHQIGTALALLKKQKVANKKRGVEMKKGIMAIMKALNNATKIFPVFALSPVPVRAQTLRGQLGTGRLCQNRYQGNSGNLIMERKVSRSLIYLKEWI